MGEGVEYIFRAFNETALVSFFSFFKETYLTVYLQRNW